MDWQKLFLTFFYTGLSPKAPGTVGTVAGLAVGVALLMVLPTTTLMTGVVALTIIAVLEINKYEKKQGVHDGKEIVIDEVAGIWLTLGMIPFEPLSIVLGFVFFRLYDITKPSIIGRIDRKMKGGMGVMLDDIVAGFFAGLTVLLLIHGYEKFMGA